MSWQWLAWENLPWIRATRGQWRYALRNTFAMCIALSFAYSLDLDQPYWAMTSAAVVSFPTIGGAISKSLGRIIGSLVGALAAILIAGNTLNDPWLFTLSFATWLGFCTWFANLHQNNVAYAFSLAGYTAALIAFSTVNITEFSQLWDIAQARVCEAITGILSAGRVTTDRLAWPDAPLAHGRVDPGWERETAASPVPSDEHQDDPGARPGTQRRPFPAWRTTPPDLIDPLAPDPVRGNGE